MSTVKVCKTKTDGNIDVENCKDLNRANIPLHEKLVNKLCNPALISSGKSEGQMKREDALETLGLDGKADAEAIKKAYHQLALKYGDATKSENDPEKMRQINLANELLKGELPGADDANEGNDDEGTGGTDDANEETADNPMKIEALKQLEWAAFVELMKKQNIFKGNESEWKIKKDEWGEGEEENVQKKRAKLLMNKQIGNIQGGRRHRRGGTKRRRKKKSKRRKSKRRKKARKSKRRKSRKKRSKRRKSRRKR